MQSDDAQAAETELLEQAPMPGGKSDQVVRADSNGGDTAANRSGPSYLIA